MIVTASSLIDLIFLTSRRSEEILRTIASHPDFQPRGCRFVVARMGGTGSAWLAKLLNSHPDVFCTHEAVAARAFPAKEYPASDILDYLRWLAWDTMHDAYAAIGDVGSVWQTHAAALDGFRTAVLVRHPARVLATRLAVYPHDQSFTEIKLAGDIREIWDIDISGLDPADQIFVHDLHVYASHVWSSRRGVRIFRIEDFAKPEPCQEAARYLTGLEYPAALVDRAIETRVNQRAEPIPVAEIVSGFTARQREWYRFMLRDAAPELGYDLESAATASAPL